MAWPDSAQVNSGKYMMVSPSRKWHNEMGAKGQKDSTKCLIKTIFSKLCRYTSFLHSAGFFRRTGAPELRHWWMQACSIRNYRVRFSFGGCSQPQKSILITCGWKTTWLCSLISAWVVSVQGRAGWTSPSLSAGRCSCPWISDYIGACSSFCIMVEQTLGFSLLSVASDTFVPWHNHMEWQWDPPRKRHSTKPAQEQLVWVIKLLVPVMTGESAGRFCSYSYPQWRVLYLPLCFKLQGLTDISLFPAVWNLVSSAVFLLPSATARLPDGNILAVFPSEDVFGNLDESREWIVSFIVSF